MSHRTTRCVCTLESAIARLAETLAAYKRLLNRKSTPQNESELWAVGMAHCEMDMQNMRDLIDVLKANPDLLPDPPL